jgi:hypothetical protein
VGQGGVVLDAQIVPSHGGAGDIRAVGHVKSRVVESAIPVRGEWCGVERDEVVRPSDAPGDGGIFEIDGELQVVPFVWLECAQRCLAVAGAQGDAGCRQDQFDGRCAGTRAEPKPMAARSGRAFGGDAEVEIDVNHAFGVAGAPRIQGLHDAVTAWAGGHAGADTTAGVEILERALGLAGHGNGAVINPRRHQHPVAATGSRRLHFEVAINVVE